MTSFQRRTQITAQQNERKGGAITLQPVSDDSSNRATLFHLSLACGGATPYGGLVLNALDTFEKQRRKTNKDKKKKKAKGSSPKTKSEGRSGYENPVDSACRPEEGRLLGPQPEPDRRGKAGLWSVDLFPGVAPAQFWIFCS